jgi:hypothetical protein
MYALFMPFWKDRAPLSRVLDHVRYRRIAPPQPAPCRRCREVRRRAVLFQQLLSPIPPTIVPLSHASIEALAEHHDVVMLNPGFRPDDHADFSAASHPRVHAFDMSGHAGENLAWQTAIIAGAQAFVGTYGGFCVPGPFLRRALDGVLLRT